MTNSGPNPDAPKPLEAGLERGGPSPELVEQFRQFEARVDEAISLIARLKKDKQELQARLEDATRARTEAAKRIDDLIDKIDGLL
jgi:chromosome segregation ATPase